MPASDSKSTRPVLQSHLPLITARATFDLATMPPLPVITPRAEFDKLPDGTINRSSLFDSHGEKPSLRSEVGKTTPKVKFAQDAAIVSDTEPTSESEADFVSESESTSSTTRLTTKKAVRTMSPRPSTALASARNFRLISKPENFKDSYKHLRELLEEHGWKIVEIDDFIQYVKDVSVPLLGLKKTAIDEEVGAVVGQAAQERFPRLALFENRWPLGFGITTAYKLNQQGLAKKDKRQKEKLALVRR